MSDVFVTCAIVALAVMGAETISRCLRLPEFAARKTLHAVVSLVVVAGVALVADFRAYAWTGLIFTLLMTALRRLPLATLGALRRGSLGEVYYPMGVAISALVAPDASAFVAAVLVLGIADTLAAVVGRRVRSPNLLGSKTLAGSVAFFLTASTLLLWVVPWPRALAVAAAGAVVETVSPKGSDNLTVPVAVAVGLSLVG